MNDVLAKTEQDSPTVSVICHCFNHEPFIRQTLESILMQETDFSVEVIAHDDASTDGTSSIIRELESSNPDHLVSIFQRENQFSQGKRPPHFTFPRARGEFIALCEGDDYWTTPDKLQKQIDALRQHPEIDLCVHPSIRLSMRTGKQKKGFDYGTKKQIISSDVIIGRHDQFAPTASMVMRTDAAKRLPDWFFNEPGLPVGDFFIEAILGRQGALYLPDTMSVYRRGVPGSYTQQFQLSGGQHLEESLARMLYFTEKLRSFDGVPEDALDQRLSYIRLNYALQFLARYDQKRFNQISEQIQLRGHRALLGTLATMRRSRLAFTIGRQAFLQLRRLKD